MRYYGFWPFSVNIRVHSTFVVQGGPVILGEYGLLCFDKHTGTVEQGEKLKLFEYLGHVARERDTTTMLRDNGQHFDRAAYTWQDRALFDQISSSWTERSGTASSDLGQPATL